MLPGRGSGEIALGAGQWTLALDKIHHFTVQLLFGLNQPLFGFNMSSKNNAHGPSQRQLRVGELIRKELSEVFLRTDINDPDVGKATIIVSEVQVSPDIRNATAYVLAFGEGEQEFVVNALNKNSKYLRGELGHRLELKHVPKLEFKQDLTFENSTRINNILNSDKVAQDLDS